eukprot:scaffold292952_cov19-Prasinocladus_malaysianus.AAC.1
MKRLLISSARGVGCGCPTSLSRVVAQAETGIAISSRTSMCTVSLPYHHLIVAVSVGYRTPYDNR